MKRIGMIGGIGWQSTLEYYRLLNEHTCRRLGSNHSAELLLMNIDRATLETDESQIYEILLTAAKKLQSGGAELVIICANGSHRFYDKLQAEISLPFIHIADATAVAIKEAGYNKVGLIGIRKTMEGNFYKDRLKQHGIEIIIPDDGDRDFINKSIFSELVCGKFTAETKEKYLTIVQKLAQQGAQGVILGCTEVPLLLRQVDTSIPLFSTTELHCVAAIKAAFTD